MLAAYLNSLHESLSRRTALVTLGIAAVVAIAFNWAVHLAPIGSDYMVMMGSRVLGPSSLAVPALFASEAQFTGFLWLLLGVLAATPLLASALDKGWLELTFSKGTARWEIMLGHYFGGITVFLSTLLLAAMPLAVRLWAKTGISPAPLLVAALLQTIGFAALMALALLATLPRKSPALPMVLALAAWIASPYLYRRAETLYVVFTASWSRAVIDWAYRILPKPSELDGLATGYIQNGHIAAWWPVWSTVAFTLVVLSVSLLVLRRKSL